MVEQVDIHPLSEATIEAITDVTKIRLNNPVQLASVGVILEKAIDLAIELDDPHLMQLVESLALHEQEIRARGVTGSSVSRVQENIQNRLGGTQAGQTCDT